MNKINKFFVVMLLIALSFSGMVYAYTAKNTLGGTFSAGDVIGVGWYNAVNKMIGDGTYTDGLGCSYSNDTKSISCIDTGASKTIMTGVGCDDCPVGSETYTTYPKTGTKQSVRCKNLLNGGSEVEGYKDVAICAVRGDAWDNKKLTPGLAPRNIGSDSWVNTYWYAYD